MALSEFISSKEGSKHKYDIIAETDGIIAMLPFGEIKSESRKNPQIVSYILSINYKDISNYGDCCQKVSGNFAL